MKIEAYFEQVRQAIDNCGVALNLPTYPHHKHVGSEGKVVASPAPDLESVLREIEMLVQL